MGMEGNNVRYLYS